MKYFTGFLDGFSKAFSKTNRVLEKARFAYGILLLLCTSCVSMAEKAGRTLDGSASEEKSLAVYRSAIKKSTAADMEIREVRNKKGQHSIIIFLDQFPSIKFRASMPDEKGEIYFMSMDYLAGSFHGWNEFRLDLFGTGRLTLDDTVAVLALPQKFETVQIASGRIRRYDTHITGSEAVDKLRDRHERITAIAGWMKQQENVPRDLSRNDFEEYWKPVLFPEMVSKKKQPAFWKQDGDLWVRAEDVRWNISYSERVFPEILREIRNSGTMLRDFEEALPWLYIEYEWERILELLAQEIALQKKK